MNLDFLSLVVASLATYLLARTWVSSDVFKYPRDKAVGWLIKGEPPWARNLGNVLLIAAVGVIIGGVTAALSDSDHAHRVAAISLAMAVALIITGEVLGHRDFVSDGIDCRLCTSVWFSAAVTASLSAWGRWPIVPTLVFGMAAAGVASLLSFTEGLIATITEGIDDDNRRKRKAERAALAAAAADDDG